MRKPLRVAIACALAGIVAGVTACGTAAEGDASQHAATADESIRPQPGGGEQEFGGEFTFLSGLSVTVSQPTSFTPSVTAYPKAERAIAFEIVIDNGTEWPYNLSDLSITTSVGGERSDELIDTTQGFNGIVDISAQVPVASNTRMTLAYVAPPRPDSIRLEVRPAPDTAASATFVGHG